MKENVFNREAEVIRNARSALTKGTLQGENAEQTYSDLLSEYEKLVRQSKRLLKMGDRMQNALSSLNEELQLREQTFRGIFENATEGIYRTDGEGTILEANSALAHMLGYPCTDSLLCRIPEISSIFSNPHMLAQYRTSLLNERVVRGMQAKLRCADGETVWAEVNAGAIETQCIEGKQDSGVVGVIADITERKRMMREMCRLARTDCLTGLWNRGYFVELAAQEIVRCRRFGSNLSLLLVDVDYFKRVNDRFGHDAGDRVLTGVAETLRSTLREVDVVARFGGEEFVVMLPDTELDAAYKAATRVCNVMRQQNFAEKGESSLAVTVSIGVTAYQGSETTLDILLKQADLAMYSAKHKGRDRVERCSLEQAGNF